LARVLTALAGGVGAARMLRGVAAVLPPAAVTAIVNTGDDFRLHGLAISPDLDSVAYTLAGASNPETGWGLAGETWTVMDALDRYGGQTWFRLGDHDLATHLYRTQRLAEGAPLSVVTAEIAAAWGVGVKLLPMTDDLVQTRVTLADDATEIGFQDYFVARRHAVSVSAVRFDGAEAARPAPGVVDSLASAERVLICPSNPVVSIGPILAVPGVGEALAERRADAVAVSPIVAGAALKGPADRLMRELGYSADVVGVARMYAPYCSTLVVDAADAHLVPQVEAEGVRCVVTDTIMSSLDASAALARVVLSC
jgi:LPPG:FO 2-phospho-L-lactate transferase